MKGATFLAVTGIAVAAVAAPAPLPTQGRITVSGQAYARLEDWARDKGFQVRWAVPREELRLTGPRGALAFFADSRRMSLNGIDVWLSAPVVMRAGGAYVAPADISGTIQPILQPAPKRLAPLRTICLDPGHGGKDPGNREGSQYEKKYTLLLAQELAEQLRRAGFNVILTRNGDTFIEKSARSEAAVRRGADLFISLHFNSADGPGGASVQGIETYCLTPAHATSTNTRGDAGDISARAGNRFDAQNILFAYRLQNSLVRKLGTADRGVRRARWAVLVGAQMPAVLIEGGFMTHRNESRRIYDTAYRRQMAQAILDGILSYKSLAGR